MDRGEGLLVAQVAHPVGLDAAGSALPGAIRIRRALNRWGWRGFLAIVFLALFGPLAILVAFSFNDSNILAFPFEGLTTKWYSLALQDPSLREALVNSTAVAFIVAPLCLVLGTLAAFGLTRFRFRGRGAIGGLVGAPAGAAVADRRDRGADGLRESQHRPEPEDRDRHADDLHVPVGDRDRRGAVVPVPAGAGGGRDRPGVLAGSRSCGTSSCRTSRRRSPPPGSSRSRGRSTTTRSARSRSGSSRRSRSGSTRRSATPITPRS